MIIIYGQPSLYSYKQAGIVLSTCFGVTSYHHVQTLLFKYHDRRGRAHDASVFPCLLGGYVTKKGCCRLTLHVYVLHHPPPDTKKYTPGLVANKQSHVTISVLFQECATSFSCPMSENISDVFCWIHLGCSHWITRQHLSMFFSMIIGLLLTIEDLMRWRGVI